ncbi:hypothetical protein EJ03DRAFT_354565 [Teratosphaeria nubilosa]|uniref:Uncharacterized protein n=1 Tax=Teratosphaeria nubilosa TaxID=161662 RepID=A0A6G1KZM7_9PEZI|nr:hypothetical protein EJ03DRAFT_354565 [Teratosphaeria nubilosa]
MSSSGFSWAQHEDACYYLLVLHQEFKSLSPQQRADLFNRQLGTNFSSKVVRDTYSSRFCTGRGQFWKRHDNQDSPGPQERARRNAVRAAQIQAVTDGMRAVGIEDRNGPPSTVIVGRNFRLCSNGLAGCKIVDLSFALDTKEKLLQQLIDQGVCEEGTVDLQFHLEGEDCGKLRPLSAAVVKDDTSSYFEPGKLKGRWIELH